MDDDATRRYRWDPERRLHVFVRDTPGRAALAPGGPDLSRIGPPDLRRAPAAAASELHVFRTGGATRAGPGGAGPGPLRRAGPDRRDPGRRRAGSARRRARHSRSARCGAGVSGGAARDGRPRGRSLLRLDRRGPQERAPRAASGVGRGPLPDHRRRDPRLPAAVARRERDSRSARVGRVGAGRRSSGRGTRRASTRSGASRRAASSAPWRRSGARPRARRRRGPRVRSIPGNASARWREAAGGGEVMGYLDSIGRAATSAEIRLATGAGTGVLRTLAGRGLLRPFEQERRDERPPAGAGPGPTPSPSRSPRPPLCGPSPRRSRSAATSRRSSRA